MPRWQATAAVRVVVLATIGTAWGCGTPVVVHPEGADAGVACYRYYDHEAHLLARHRGTALAEIRAFCDGAFHIVQEGATRGRRQTVTGVGGPTVIKEQWWGIRFKCE